MSPMTAKGIRDEWSVMRICLKWKWPDLCENHLDIIGRSEEDLLEILREKTGESRENLIEIIKCYRKAPFEPESQAAGDARHIDPRLPALF